MDPLESIESIEALNDETNDSLEVSDENLYNLTEESDDDVGCSINASDEVILNSLDGNKDIRNLRKGFKSSY
ncbi:22258_t:CDS:2 [Gigaspora margarita]|uniref:22258_t:CDS:1 n=1 Tax=Gigaspora margarita TaxID=4874 RepID=A0ABN7U0A5_GIGMA|nr:22258_t:CDS:2 [Gigaspora margarita]